MLHQSEANYTCSMPDIARTSAPWLFVRDSFKAVQFYKDAFGAIETYRHEGRGGVVARLSIGSSEFWVSDESPEHGNFSPETLRGTSFRILITDPDPDLLFARATNAGAGLVHPMSEGHGWRVGRLVDPFGHHWEIGRQI
jgi:PhnB protein